MSIGSDHDIDTVISIPETSRTAASEMMMMIAMQVKRWISEHVKARWMLHALDQGATQAMDHEEILGAIHQGARY